MNKDEKIKNILNRLLEVHSEKEPFLPTKPLDSETNPKIWRIIEFRKYGELCKEEKKLFSDLEELER